MSRKRKLSESVKKEVAHRQNYICCKCGQILPPTYQTDHIIPHSISNDDSFENLQALCPNCHSVKTKRYMMQNKPANMPRLNSLELDRGAAYMDLESEHSRDGFQENPTSKKRKIN